MHQIQSILSSKNQIVVPARVRRALKLAAGDKLFWRLTRIKNQPKAVAEPEPKSWAGYMRGLGKDVWKGISVKEYIEDLRNEWQK